MLTKILSLSGSLGHVSMSPFLRTKSEQLGDPFITAGDRAYLIGAQDGGFPDMGWHVSGEMGGLWTHPVKLLDGFWLEVGGHWLENACRFTSGHFWSTHSYHASPELSVSRLQYAPDGEPVMVVRYSFCTQAARTIRVRLLARTDIQEVWPSPHDGSILDTAVMAPELGAWICGRSDIGWSVVVGTRQARPIGWTSGYDLWGPEHTAGQGISVALEYLLDLPAGEQIDLEFLIFGSEAGEEIARSAFARLQAETNTWWQAKEARYQRLLTHSTLFLLDEPAICASWDWLKCNFDWLVRDVPGVGRGLGAGAPEYVWWFGCDTSYSALGCLALGQHETAIETLDLVRALSIKAHGDSGRVIHECNTAGDVVHPGNVQETPQFVSAVWQTFCWTGDHAFLQRSYEFCRRGLLDWLLGENCAAEDLLPRGYGILEVPDFDLRCVDTAVHTVQSLAALSRMAAVLDDQEISARSGALHAAALTALRQAFWMEDEGLYGDIVGTPAEMMPRLRKWLADAASMSSETLGDGHLQDELWRLLRQAESDPQPARPRAWLCKSSLVATPFAEALGTPGQASRALPRLEGEEFTGPWGMYVSGLDRATTMSITTGELALAELNYGRVDQGIAYLRRMAETLDLQMPGAISEISPDAGCFVQAWSGYAIAWPVVTRVFGIQPDAFRKRLVLEPRFPTGWSGATLTGLRIGGNSFDLGWDGESLQYSSRESGWTVTSTNESLQIQEVAVT